MKKLLAVIIKGNPKYIHNDIARLYYKDIANYLKQKDFKVQFDEGKEYTRPRIDADLYIGHSRGVDRYNHMPDRCKKVFLKFGVIGGIIHPVDLKWQKEVWYPGINQQPPKEHFEFIDQQKKAIDNLAEKILKNKTTLESLFSDVVDKTNKLKNW